MLADVQFSSRDRALIARVSGEVDLSNAKHIERTLLDATSGPTLALVLDLSGVDYLDSTGIQMIYQLRESLHAEGQTLRVVIPPVSATSDALRLASVTRFVDADATVDEALHELG